MTASRASAIPVFVFEGMSSAFGSAVGGGELVGHVVVVGVLAWCAYLSIWRRSVPAGPSRACWRSRSSTSSWASSATSWG